MKNLFLKAKVTMKSNMGVTQDFTVYLNPSEISHITEVDIAGQTVTKVHLSEKVIASLEKEFELKFSSIKIFGIEEL